MWLRIFRPVVAAREVNRGTQEQWQSINFKFPNSLRAYGGYRVSESFSGVAKVVDREEFMRHDFHDQKMREEFNQKLKEFFHKTAESLGYQYLYLPWLYPGASYYQPSEPRFYRFERDAAGSPVKIWRDLNQSGLVEEVIERIPLIYGCKLFLMNDDIINAEGQMKEDNYELVPLVKRIQADPEYLDYVSALAVSMSEKSQKLTSELDVAEYSSEMQPLKIFVRTLRDSEQVTIQWEIPGTMPLAAIVLFGLQP
jgi:hypothetical protein